MPNQRTSLWRNRDYLFLVSGQAISSMGTEVSDLAYILLVLALTGSPAQVGFVGALEAAPVLILSMPAGALIDRWDRKRVMIFCDMARAIILASLPIAFLIGHLTLVQIYITALLEPTFGVFFDLAERACLPQMVPREQLPAVSSQNQAGCYPQCSCAQCSPGCESTIEIAFILVFEVSLSFDSSSRRIRAARGKFVFLTNSPPFVYLLSTRLLYTLYGRVFNASSDRNCIDESKDGSESAMNNTPAGATQTYRHVWLRFLIVIVVLLILGLFLELPPLNAAHSAEGGLSTSIHPTGDTSWPGTYLGDNGRSNFNSAETIITPSTAPTLQQVWEQATKDPISTQPVIANNLLYWGSWSGYEYATNPSTGQEVWSQFLGFTRAPKGCDPSEAGVASTPTVTTITLRGKPTPVILLGGGNARFYALNALTGAILWQHSLGRGSHGAFIWSSPAVYNSSVYIGLSSFGDCPLIQARLFQLDPSTGNILNTFDVVPTGCIGASIWGSPTIDEQSGMLYFATGNGGRCEHKESYAIALVELQASNLSFVADWQIPHPKGDSDFGSTPTLFQATINNTLYHMIGLINKNGTYYAFDRSNIGAGPLWQDQLALSKQEGGKGVNISSSAWDGTTLYAAAGSTVINGTVCRSSVSAINPADGSFLWRDCLHTTPPWAPVMVVPGVVVVGTGSTLYVLSATGGSILFSFTDAHPRAIFAGSATISNGVLYAGDYYGDLYAFAPESASHRP